jgi:signal transduction histidine kinase
MGHVSSLHGADGRLWIGTADEGVFVFDGAEARTEFALQPLVGSTVWAMAGSAESVLWLATAKGLYVWSAGTLTPVIPDVDARALAIARDGAQSAWCGTVGGGLYRVVLNGPEGEPLVSRIDSEQGLPSASVFSVLAVPGTADREKLWIGASRGVARYEPGHLAPALNVTRVLGRRVFTPEEIRSGFELEYPQKSLAVEVAAASTRTFPEQFQYVFTLTSAEGVLIQRKLSRDPQFLMENLKAGRYQLTAGAFTRDLVSSKPARFEFSVAPVPFPWTSAALSTLLLLALVAMTWGYRQNTRLARANATLATTNAQLAETRVQLANETEAERRRIARDLHDQTLADLRRLMMLTDRLPEARAGAGDVQPSEFRQEIESVSTEVRRICEDLSPSALANVGLAAALEWALAETAASQPDGAKFEYACSVEPGIEESISLDGDSAIQVYRIVQEALSNVSKHAAASRVNLTMSRSGADALEITLEDDGRGFDIRSAAPSGRGLSNIRSRASLIDATVEWTPRSGGGTVFRLRKHAESGRRAETSI